MRLRHLVCTATAAGAAVLCAGSISPVQAQQPQETGKTQQPQETGKTPGTYAYWSAPDDVSWFTMPMNLQVDPGNYNAYWSTQFDFTGDASGYMGFQTHDDGGGMFLVSIWNATEAQEAGGGTYCDKFNEGGTGWTCRLDARPKAGHQYELSAVQEDGGWWRYSFVDKTDGTSQDLGRIKTNGDQALAGDSFNSWTEYFDWNDPNTECRDAEYSKMLFGTPRTSAGDGDYTSSDLGEYCQWMAKVTLDDSGATEENGIGQ